jgi:hypothetical protein
VIFGIVIESCGCGTGNGVAGGVVGLVGAVGIENNDDWNLKDLREMRRNAKSLQRNDEAGKGILIAPSKLPRFPRSLRFQRCAIPLKALDRESAFGPNFAARMASRRLSKRSRSLSCRIHFHFGTGACGQR